MRVYHRHLSPTYWEMHNFFITLPHLIFICFLSLKCYHQLPRPPLTLVNHQLIEIPLSNCILDTSLFLQLPPRSKQILSPLWKVAFLLIILFSSIFLSSNSFSTVHLWGYDDDILLLKILRSSTLFSWWGSNFKTGHNWLDPSWSDFSTFGSHFTSAPQILSLTHIELLSILWNITHSCTLLSLHILFLFSGIVFSTFVFGWSGLFF